MRVKVSTVQRDAARRLVEIALEEGDPVDDFLLRIAQTGSSWIPRPKNASTAYNAWADTATRLASSTQQPTVGPLTQSHQAASSTTEPTEPLNPKATRDG